MSKNLQENICKKISTYFAKKSPGQPDGWYWNLLPFIINKITPLIVRTWGRTLEYHVEGQENLIEMRRKKEGMLLGTWHGNMSASVFYMRDKNLLALVSPHWLGELIVSAVTTLGFGFIRASSGYNAKQGLRDILSAVRSGKSIAIMLDGPDGPAKQVNAGIVQMSMLSGKPIIVAFSAGTKYIRFNSWDKHEWPLPFSKVEMRFSKPLYIPRRSTKAEQEGYKKQIEKILQEMEREVRTSLANYNK